MKSVFSSLLFLLVASSASAQTMVPDDSLFQQIFDQARKFRYIGPPMVCLNSKNIVVLGGAAHFGAGIQLFLVNAKGESIKMTKVSARSESHNLRFTVGSEDVAVDLADPTAVSGDIYQQKGLLTIGSTDIAQRITCFRRFSGLE